MSTPREIIAEAFLDVDISGDTILSRTDAAIAALTEAGWQIVPVEPTEEMLFAGFKVKPLEERKGCERRVCCIAY